MKKLIAQMLVLAVMATFLNGCASVHRATEFNGLADADGPIKTHYSASVSGLYAIVSVPLITGDTEGGGFFVFMQDTASLQNTVDFLTKNAKQDGASKIIDMASGARMSMIPFPLPFILWWKSVHVSATAL
ncbi:hypothetical protein JXA32_01530 [Candidatus Sumerlaeota bacterium]|nr:hypothetical protein [Candidatus Sumerlaeota bacterium]